MNLEYLLVDSRTFVTAEEGALRTFFGAAVDSSTSYRAEIEVMTARLASVFATLREMPAIRFRAATPPGEEFPPGLESRLLVAQRIAVELNERLAGLQRQGLLPERETCELVLTDRGFDTVAPVIHEWTYEAMALDLLEGTPCLQVGARVLRALRVLRRVRPAVGVLLRPPAGLLRWWAVRAGSGARQAHTQACMASATCRPGHPLHAPHLCLLYRLHAPTPACRATTCLCTRQKHREVGTRGTG